MTVTRTTVGGRRRYAIDGDHYDSVTAVIGRAVAKPALTNWGCSMGANAALAGDPEPTNSAARHLRAAGNRGTAVHAWCEAQLLDMPPPTIGANAPEAPYIASLAKWMDEAEPRPVLVECVVYSPEHGYAGTLDGVWEIGGCRYLIDVKTNVAPKVYPEHLLQLAAYRHAERIAMGGTYPTEWPAIDGCAIVLVSPERATLQPVDVGADAFAAFLHALGLARWLWGQES